MVSSLFVVWQRVKPSLESACIIKSETFLVSWANRMVLPVDLTFIFSLFPQSTAVQLGNLIHNLCLVNSCRTYSQT